MAYLPEVRLRRAHRTLLESDVSTVTGGTPLGFGNLGRFAAMHADRYRETPRETLRRNTFRRSA